MLSYRILLTTYIFFLFFAPVFGMDRPVPVLGPAETWPLGVGADAFESRICRAYRGITAA